MILLLAVVLAQAAGAEFDWKAWEQQTEREMVRLAPTAFPSLPVSIQKHLSLRGCTVPQVGGEKRPHNVISGAFQVAGRKDWAILCSINKESRIFIYQGGSVANVYELPNSLQPDNVRFQTGVGYSRMIAPADAEAITYYKEEFDGPEPPPIDHDGIEDAFVEKASAILYWHNGRWHRLAGQD
jgi:hypothetical protein